MPEPSQTTTPLTSAYWPATAAALGLGRLGHPRDHDRLGPARCRRARTGKAALVDGDPDRQGRQWTYAELLADAERAARALLTRFTPGERVAVWARNSPEWVVLDFAGGARRADPRHRDPAYQGEELANVPGHSEADGLSTPAASTPNRAVLAEIRDRLPRLRDVLSFETGTVHRLGRHPEPARRALPASTPSSAAKVLYTSGTTGRPKGAVLTHRGLTNNARLAFEAAGIGPDDVEINPMPLFHVGGSVLFTLGAVQATATQVLMSRFSPALELELIEARRVSVLCGVPTMPIALLSHPDLATRDVSALRMIFTGGAVSPPALVPGRGRAGCWLHDRVRADRGRLRVAMTTAADAPDDRAETSDGRCRTGGEDRPEHRRDGGLRESGEICARGYL